MVARFLGICFLMMMALSSTPGASSGGPTTQQSNPFTGEWAWAFDFTPGLVVGASAKFIQKGDKLSGTAEIGEHSRALRITNGKVDGDKISFEVSDVRDDLPLTLKFSGVLVDGKIKGNVQVLVTNQDGKTTKTDKDWTAERSQVGQPEPK